MRVTHESGSVNITFEDRDEKEHKLQIFERKEDLNDPEELVALYKGPGDEEWEAILSVLL